MKERVEFYLAKAKELILEIDNYTLHKELAKKSLERTYQDYQQKKYDYFAYKKTVDKILQGKTENEFFSAYDEYTNLLLGKVELINSKIFAIYYEDASFERLQVARALEKAARPVEAELPFRRKKIAEAKPAVPEEKAREEIKVPEYRALPELEPIVTLEPAKVKSLDFRKISREQRKQELQRLKQKREPFRQSFFAKIGNFFKYRKAKPLIDKIISEREDLEPRPKRGERLRVENLIGSLFKLAVFRREAKKDDFIGKDTHIERTIFPSKEGKIEKFAEIKPLSREALMLEARRLKTLMKKEGELKFYAPSSISAIANMTTRKFTLFFLDRFPSLFRSFYNTLRLANFRILSNTYINLAVLFSFFFGVMGAAYFTMHYMLSGDPLLLFMTKGIFMGMMTAILTSAAFYVYPFARIKMRRRSINANLPFAITHMSSVANAGVTPTEMFKLIASSKEYGELGAELEKLTEYIDVFGYDLVTAIKSISSVTPSPQLKEFLDGLLSSVETGGDLKQFLSQKAEESMLTYKLERQKYSEIVSTYSDIYTGLLIAAPLFFVASLSLVSMLGGKIGGVDIKLLLVLSTYVVIPLLNVFFMLFIEINQPEV